MIHDIMPGTEALLQKEMTTAYVGFDPTASSLTIGNLVTIMLLVHLQKAGHRPMALVGGATGMIGDPSGRSEERNLLSEEALRHNQACIQAQLEKFLDFNAGERSAVMVNNYDWFKEIGFIAFLRDVGKHLSINYMMAKDSVQKRLETGISFTEFSYQLLQGYDFYYLNKTNGVKLQMGGSDQWGNITAGTELIRRMGQGEGFALTCPLITKSDGTKFGKSAGGNVWLDAKLTSPYKFYQFWVNASDEDAAKWIRIFTTLNQEHILDLEAQHSAAPEKRILQKALAEDITTRVHSATDLEKALKATEILFGKSAAEEIATLDEATLLDAFEGVPFIDISQSDYNAAANVTELLSVVSKGQIFPSKGEARKMIQQGGISINKQKLAGADEPITFDLLQGKYLLIQKGKKQYYLISIHS